MSPDIAATVWITLVLLLVGRVTVTALCAYALWWLVDRTIGWLVREQ